MAIEVGFGLIRDILLQTTMFNIYWLGSLLVTGLSLLAITREMNKWTKYAFLVMIGWHIAGIPPFIGIYIVAAIAYVLSHLSIQAIGELVGVAAKPIKNFAEENKWFQRREKTHKQRLKHISDEGYMQEGLRQIKAEKDFEQKRKEKDEFYGGSL